jgi:archaellum component FlaC
MDDQRLTRIEAKIDDLSEHLGSIDSTLAGQHAVLREHIRRTAALEKKLEPVEKHVTIVHGIFKLIGVMGTVAAIVSTVLKLMKVI